MPFNNQISRGSAGALIPEEVSTEILKGVENDSLVADAFRTVRMSRKQTRLPVLSALPVAYFVNGDTGLKQTTQIDWSNKYLNAEEIAAIVPIPEAVLDDTDYDIWGEAKPLITEAIARCLDAAVLFGTNAPAAWPQNIVAAAAAAGNTVNRGSNAAATGGIVGDFSDLFGKMEADGYDPDYVAAITTYKGRLRQARATTGEALEEVETQVTQKSVYGAPVKYPARGLWPTGSGAAEALALERDQFIVGIRQDITWKILTEAVITDNTGAIIYNLAQQDMVAMRVVFRAAWQVANTINYDQPTEANRYPAAVMLAP